MMKSSEISKFASSSEEPVRSSNRMSGVSSAASSSIFVLVEGIEFLQLLVRIGVHGAELQEVEYPVVTAYTLRLIDDFTLTFETDGNGSADK